MLGCVCFTDTFFLFRVKIEQKNLVIPNNNQQQNGFHDAKSESLVMKQKMIVEQQQKDIKVRTKLSRIILCCNWHAFFYHFASPKLIICYHVSGLDSKANSFYYESWYAVNANEIQ